ncbi:hypothetical protein [Colwellia psychrerythraea]|uniref:Uncharacterized protein n=1 Tax=Colwellia psychrerythraea TaxID=28229 RepID=A0A099KD18_COLPS|nr:hypothetical protein [Colwellia psychrerythraea]KGJ88599.1 hypothetical protein ND2E_3897 [Colwellia psychrerythraea]
MPKVLICLFLVLTAFPSTAEPRANLHLFQYGLTTTEHREALFKDFRYVLEQKMPRLSDELALNDDWPALNVLMVVPVNDEKENLRLPASLIGNSLLKENYWRDTGALALLTGVVVDRGEVPYIHTTLYWGKLKSPLAQKMIDLQLPLVGKYFDTTFDSHSVAILYAIANQPDVQCNQLTSIIALLSEAQKRAKSVSEQQPELGAELETMIVASIQAHKEECNR